MDATLDHKKHSLGRRAFALFFFRRSKSLVIFAILTAATWYLSVRLPDPYMTWTGYVAYIFAIMTLAIFLVVIIRTFLEYHFYTYTFTDDAFIVTQGYIVRDEVATLYHQIQNVNIKRTPIYRLVGVSQLVILMSGSGHAGQTNTVILPAVAKKKAAMVQREILSRARKHHEGATREAISVAAEETRK